MNASKEFDVVIIGAGAAGLMCAIEAGISTTGERSVRLKTIPVLIGAGRKVRSTFSPECKPTPVA